ncbi:MAG: SpoIVB peptidase [Armatimonadetes bacterium]|nr:SpoIVB peptidase [Armatimonadota bacterium]
MFWTLLYFFLLTALIKSLFVFPARQNIKAGDPLVPRAAFHSGLSPYLSAHFPGRQKIDFSRGVPVAPAPGLVHVQWKLFGLIPLQEMLVNVINPPKVMVCGHSIGVLLHAEGVLVVGHTVVEDPTGKKHHPAEKAGILAGDLIIKVNNIVVQNDQRLRDEIERSGRKGKSVTLEVRRKNKTFPVKVNPVFCKETGRYRIGLFIRDSAAGMGTLTFYDPQTKLYGALGHMVTGLDNPAEVDLSAGKIVNVLVQDIYPGGKGKPGEKIGAFSGKTRFTGNIQRNTPFGIFGTLRQPPDHYFYPKPLPVALAYEITTGPAEILTVLSDERIERFAIEIEKVHPQIRPEGKGLVIKVTDRDLIRRAGGIIQGMSGSPIIQNGKFVGVVTHVFVNDPTRGYGVPAEWMLQEAGFFASGRKNKFVA